MSLPRQILPGATYLVTRRCSQRQFLLAPSAYVRQVFLYCLAVAAERTGVLVHAVTVMSNHYHLIATDPLGRLPEFCAWLHEFVGRSLNAHYGRWENFWASTATSMVRLENDAAVLEKTIYALANPVEAGLVSRGDDWPGVRMYMPGQHKIERPSGFFRAKGPTPEFATLNIVPPPLVATAERTVLERITDALKAREEEIRAGFKSSGRRFVGPVGIRAQRPSDVPRTDEPRRGLSPRVACRDKWRRIEALQRCKQFVGDYRVALRRWLAGVRDVVFPSGTYQMALRYGVTIAPS